MEKTCFGETNSFLEWCPLEATHTILGWWGQGSTEGGNVQGPFEMLFVFTDIFSFGLGWPIFAKGNCHAGWPSFRRPSVCSLQKRSKASQSVSWRWGRQRTLQQMPGEADRPSACGQVAAVTPRLKIKSEAWTVVWSWMAVSVLLK